MIWSTFNKSGESYSPDEIKDIIILTRLSLYNQGLPCGARAIRWKLYEQDIRPLPSTSYIGRVLRREWLTYHRTGRY